MPVEVIGPFKVTRETLRCHNTLEKEDLGKWFLVVNGALQLYRSKYAAEVSKSLCNAFGR